MDWGHTARRLAHSFALSEGLRKFETGNSSIWQLPIEGRAIDLLEEREQLLRCVVLCCGGRVAVLAAAALVLHLGRCCIGVVCSRTGGRQTDTIETMVSWFGYLGGL